MVDDQEETAIAVRHAREAAARWAPGRRGSVPGHLVIDRDHAGGHARIMADYFIANPVYTDYHFRHRYRMRRPLFLRIMNNMMERDPWFLCHADAT
ncbi:hypothetical protein BAE44_0012300 [Dichanthelium oligosanthes]|uniref:Uncharacterized protein n=1 Tax=Dichanthelium oligosanthes TaxID=888268 RepID=A0A1E5VNG8_9POAL|nr:hypothetical protein BAE44_0012300 [Dichanthelium oligosanthes]